MVSLSHFSTFSLLALVAGNYCHTVYPGNQHKSQNNK